MKHKLYGALFGGFVGDALGVPVEFKSREELDANPVTDMVGYGTYNQPPGTWSDDTTMALAMMHVINEHGKAYPEQLMQEWSEWYTNAKWTPYDEVFDIGNSTANAIYNYCKKGIFWAECGGFDIDSNGNGSLMRAMPCSLHCHFDSEAIRSKTVSETTHGHSIAVLCCMYHERLVHYLLLGETLETAMRLSSRDLSGDLAIVDSASQDELSRIFDGSVIYTSREYIRGSGYVVHCLEASLWCIYQTDNFKDAVLEAVNLGEDTDTTGCVTGGLAGLIYGHDSIPEKWINTLAKLDELQELCDKFIETIS